MKSKLFIFSALVSAVLIAFLLSIGGISNGLPSEKVKSLLFSSQDLAKIIIPKIVEFRQVDKEYTDRLKEYKDMVVDGRYYMNLPDTYIEDIEREQKVILAGRRLFVSQNKLKWLGNKLIGSFCAEEQIIMHAISRLRPEKLELNTHLLAYGGAYIYPVAATIKMSSLCGFTTLNPDRTFNMFNPGNVRKIFISARLVSIIAFLLSILLIYFVTNSLYRNRFISLLSTFLLATNVGFLVKTSYLNPWLYSTFWALVALYFASKIESVENDKKYYLLAGIAAGLALGSIFPGGFIFLAIIIFHLYKYKRHRITLLLYSFTVMLIVFFIVNPYFLFSFSKNLNNFKFHNESWFNQISYFSLSQHVRNIYEITQGLGIVFSIFILIGILLAIFRRGKNDVVLACCIIAYYLVSFKVISLKYSAVSHIMPLIPLMIIIGTRALSWLWEFKGKIGKIFAIFLTVFIMLNSFSKSIFCAYKLKAQPLIGAGEWINANVPFGSSIGSWLCRDGLRSGYPPYNYLNYRFVNDSDISLSKIQTQRPDYYIAISMPYLKDPFLENDLHLKDYHQVKSFNSDVPLLSKFYKNELLHLWVEEIKIFKYIGK